MPKTTRATPTSIPTVRVRAAVLGAPGAPGGWSAWLLTQGLAAPLETTRYLFDDADLLVSPEGGCSVLMRGLGPRNGAPRGRDTTTCGCCRDLSRLTSTPFAPHEDATACPPASVSAAYS